MNCMPWRTASIRSGGSKRLEPRPRILITGCPIGGAAEKVVRAIEENGGWVVGYENCTGAKATERCVAEEGDVYDALPINISPSAAPVSPPTTSVCSC
jgi:benzoyl-CoA reductase/2-hydroxyglutaryl-CoA dehydratase subunit BcrC/BadD/HgdB